MAAVVSFSAAASTAIIHRRRRGVDLDITHALGYVSVAPVASLAHIAPGLQNLLLCPNGVASLVIPSALGRIAGREALLVVEPKRNRDTGTDYSLKHGANLGTD